MRVALPLLAGASECSSAKKPQLGKSGKKICCSCPATKKKRDECIVTNGQEHCSELIEKHKECLRAEGFRV